jgi:hypothetical protein
LIKKTQQKPKTKTKNQQQTMSCDKYICTKETLQETVEKFGVAIIPNVLNEQETDQMVSGTWDFFEHITKDWIKPKTPINRDDKATWRGMYDLFPSHSMLFQYFGVGQAQVSWDVRQNEKIVDIFATFWKSRDLLVSFDGLSFNMPPEVTNRGWHRNTWYHTDQSFMRPEFECLQTWVTALDVEDGDATLAFYEGSNKFHREFQEEFKVTSKKDWYKLNKEEEQFYMNKCEPKKIMCPRGSLVCWDSRTIHCGVEASRGRKNQKLRSVIYLCYQPRTGATLANIKKKRKAFNEMRSTAHWPCKVKLFGKKPRTYGAELPTITPIEKPILTSLGKQLAGF